jgi:hypothetical protein
LPASKFLKVLNSSFSMPHTKSAKSTTALRFQVNLMSLVAVVRSFQLS